MVREDVGLATSVIDSEIIRWIEVYLGRVPSDDEMSEYLWEAREFDEGPVEWFYQGVRIVRCVYNLDGGVEWLITSGIDVEGEFEAI